jgi:hypothetical protein
MYGTIRWIHTPNQPSQTPSSKPPPRQLLCQTWRLYGAVGCVFGPAFWAMMVQMPLTHISSALVPKTETGAMVGNLMFWVIFCGIIQPLVVSRLSVLSIWM